ncbi:unnamed protein product [Sphenostylis stenocarpa]|uniref:Uncharacterized protein n=1 Tax=Sphenostylis stenocarpa TaxID=92480 RepID=A0AA86T0K8_9FABA|nr:unnamed protein product [Sphenostylis stenocarpa]
MPEGKLRRGIERENPRQWMLGDLSVVRFWSSLAQLSCTADKQMLNEHTEMRHCNATVVSLLQWFPAWMVNTEFQI